jgi:hypothetical protein
MDNMQIMLIPAKASITVNTNSIYLQEYNKIIVFNRNVRHRFMFSPHTGQKRKEYKNKKIILQIGSILKIGKIHEFQWHLQIQLHLARHTLDYSKKHGNNQTHKPCSISGTWNIR